jgi:hypothetical protein
MSLAALPKEVLRLIVVPLNRWDTYTLILVNKEMKDVVDDETTWLLKVRYRLGSRPVVNDAKAKYICSLDAGVATIRSHEGAIIATIPRRDVVKVAFAHGVAVVVTIDGECWLYFDKVRLLDIGVTDCLIIHIPMPIHECYGVWLVKSGSLKWFQLDQALEERKHGTVQCVSPVRYLICTVDSCVTCLLENNDVVMLAGVPTGGWNMYSVLEHNVLFYHWEDRCGNSVVERDGWYGKHGIKVGCNSAVKKYFSRRRQLVLTDEYVPDIEVQLLTKDVKDVALCGDSYCALMRNGTLRKDDSTVVDVDVISLMNSYRNDRVVCYITEPN